MRRFSRLFWKIFGTIWGISALAMASIFIVLASRDDSERWRYLLDTQFRDRAQQLIARYETAPEAYRPERHPFGRHPVWLYRLDAPEGKPVARLAGQRRGPSDKAVTLNLVSERGGHYRLSADLPGRYRHKERFIGYLFSLQALVILVIAALSSLVLSLLLVRPICQLRDHVKQLYHQGDLSARASDKLSQRRDELGDLTREFDRMADYVEHTLQSQQRLLQDVSHELRAPMARLQVSAGLAEQQLGADSPLAARINRECERLDGLIAEILSFSRLESAPKQGEPFSVSGLFDELVSDLRFSQPQRPVTVRISPDNLTLTLNRDLLARALRNGIGNALKYTPQSTPLELTAVCEGGRTQIRLRDHGGGVSDALLQELFTPFVRGSGGHGDGYGLGMSIAHRAVTRLGGTLTAANHPQGGLQLTLDLPRI